MMIALGAFGVFLTSALGLDRHAQLALSSRNAAIVREVDLEVVEVDLKVVLIEVVVAVVKEVSDESNCNVVTVEGVDLTPHALDM